MHRALSALCFVVLALCSSTLRLHTVELRNRVVNLSQSERMRRRQSQRSLASRVLDPLSQPGGVAFARTVENQRADK